MKSNAPSFRDLMATRKEEVLGLLSAMGMSPDQGWTEEQLATFTNQIMRKVLKRPEALQNQALLEEMVTDLIPVQMA